MSEVFVKEVETDILENFDAEFFKDDFEQEETYEEDGLELLPVEKIHQDSDNLLNLYMKEIAPIPLLTRDEELRYGRMLKKGQKVEEEMNKMHKQLGSIPSLEQLAKKLDLTQIELKQVQKDAMIAYNKLVTSNLRLVVSIAKKYKDKGLSFDDLIQEGNLGLIRAVQKFDADKGYKFSTYATWWIRQAISRGLATKGRTIRLPLHIVEVTQKVKNTIRKMTQQNGRKPNTHDLSKEMDIPMDKLMMISEAFSEPISLDMKLKGEDDVYVKDLIQSSVESPEDFVMKDSLKDNLERVLKTLPEKERNMISMRYGLDDGKQKSLQDIADVFGITRERVRQIVNSAMKKLRTPDKIKKLSAYVA